MRHFILCITFFLFIAPASASFTLEKGNAEDLCTGPEYSGQADLVGRFQHNKFLFNDHQEYEFRPAFGEEAKLPLSAFLPQYNSLLKLHLTPEQAAQLSTDRIIKIKIENYQAFCEGIPAVDFVNLDGTFKNMEGNWLLTEGSPEPNFLGDIVYQGEETITGKLRSSADPFGSDEKTGITYFLEPDRKNQSILPLQKWNDLIPDHNTRLLIRNSNEKKPWLTQNVNKLVAVTIDQYRVDLDDSLQVRIKTNFMDVDPNNSLAADIQFLKSRNMVSGYSDGTFQLGRTLNRAEFSKIALLSKMAEDDIDPVQNCFPDVQKQWFAPYVCALKNGGAIQGYTDGKFHPEQTITLAEALKILMKMSTLQYESTTPWTEGVMEKAAELQLISLNPPPAADVPSADYFKIVSPNAPLTRGQMAGIIAQMVRLKLS